MKINCPGNLLVLIGPFLISFLGPQHAWAAEDLPKHSIQQNAPCSDQPKSFAALKREFDTGTVPSPSETTGSWVAVGFGTSGRHGKEDISTNCTGLLRGSKLEQVILVKEYSVETHIIGTSDQKEPLQPDGNGSVTFPLDFGGDANPVYRCRLTARKTLVCLIDVYQQGVEFKKMSITPDKIYSSKEMNPPQ